MEKFTLITGATGGLGRAFCKLYAADRNNLMLVGTSEQKLLNLKAELTSAYPDILIDCFVADLSDRESLKAVFSYTKSKGYFINHLVNNAGFGDRTDFKDMDADLQLSMIEVNCSALTYFTRVYLTDMLAYNEGRIINVGSIAGFVPGPYMCTYHATKAYVLNFGESVSHELRKTNVRLLTLCPGPFDSGFVAKAGNSYTFEKIRPISADEVAAYGYRQSKKGKRVAVVGFKNKITVFLPRLVPRAFVAATSAKTLKKDA